MVKSLIDISLLPLKDIIEWDILNWSQLVEYWEPIVNTFPSTSRVLTIGERNGGMTLWLALKGFQVVCTDREGPTSHAVELHKQYGVSDLITYSSFDLVAENDDFVKYDLVVAKSVLGGIKTNYKDSNTRNVQAQKLAIANMHKLLNTGGHVLIAENMKGSWLLNFLRKCTGRHKGWYYFTEKELHKLFGIFSGLEIRSFGVIPTVFRLNVINKIFFYLNKYLLKSFPPGFKYIAFVSARK